MEIFKPVPGFDDYLISDQARLWNLRINKITVGCVTYGGYVKVSLYGNGESHARSVHQLVAQAFIDNPKSKKEIHHKNGNKEDNRPDNLVWVTSWEHGEFTRAENIRKEVEREERWQRKLEEISCLKKSHLNLL